MKSISVLIILSFAFAGCGSEQTEHGQNSTANPPVSQAGTNLPAVTEKVDTVKQTIQYELSGIPFDLSGKPVTIAGITFTPAIQWKDLGAKDMRKASYSYGPLESDKEPANLNVYYFGEGQGGSIEANFDRWIKQMSMPDGSDVSKAAIRYSKDVNGLMAHVLTLYGTFNEPVGGPMSSVTTPLENYRLIGVIIEAPQGNVFFKLTGPDYTSKIMVEAFITMINQVQKASA